MSDNGLRAFAQGMSAVKTAMICATILASAWIVSSPIVQLVVEMREAKNGIVNIDKRLSRPLLGATE